MAFNLPNLLGLGVVLGLFLIMYPAMSNVRLEDMRKAFKSPKQFGIVAFYNYLVAPLFMLVLAWLFLRNSPDLYTGPVLYGFAPCIAMVIVFTYLAKGNNALALLLVAFNSVIQMILIPVHAKLLLGRTGISTMVVGESVALYLGLPVVAGFLTRRIGVVRWGEQGFERFKKVLSAVSIIGPLFTLIVMFALKGDLILESPLLIIRMVVPMTLFLWASFIAVFYSREMVQAELRGLRGRRVQLNGRGF